MCKFYNRNETKWLGCYVYNICELYIVKQNIFIKIISNHLHKKKPTNLSKTLTRKKPREMKRKRTSQDTVYEPIEINPQDDSPNFPNGMLCKE